jgi:TonB family protein
MRDWELLYERPSVRTDAMLLALAMLIHVPLLTMHMSASKRAGNVKVDRLVNIDYIEMKAQERKNKPVALPPKLPDVKKIEDAAKKMADIKNALLKKAAPKPVVAPKIEVKKDLAVPLDPTKIQMELKKQLDQKMQTLKSDKSFMDKPGQLPGSNVNKEIKIGGGVSAIRMGAKEGGPAGPAGPVLRSKSGFAVSEKSAPMGIGGDDAGIKIGGAAAVVVPTGSRARADSSILSPVASIKDKGSLQGKAGGGGTGGPGTGGGGPSGLALGPGGPGGSIAVAGRPSGTAVAAPTSVLSSGKTFSGGSSGGSSSVGLSAGPKSMESLPQVAAIQRRTARPSRPLFQITGPLEKRPVVSKVIPAYPEWARAKGIEASVTLQFTVDPEGRVKPTVLTLRTSGYPQLDQTAVDALRKWVFQALPSDQLRDEVGAITFTFSVR